jgi:hypothetical protein
VTGGCIFCGRAPTTNAHIFRKGWIDELFPHMRTFRHRHIRREEKPFDHGWSMSAADFKVNCACKTCNNGWMDRLDHAAEDIFATAAAIGYPARVERVADKFTVALWCTLIAILFDQAQAWARVSPHVHEALYRGDMPDGVWIWLARTDPGADALIADASVKDMTLVHEPRKGNLREGHAYFITFRVYHLVAQGVIATERTPEGIEFERVNNRAVLRRLWPDVLTPLVWPPPQSLPWEQMEAFKSAFKYWTPLPQ